MKEGLRRVRGTTLPTDVGEITLIDTFREGTTDLKQSTANTINSISPQNMIRLLLRSTTSRKKSHKTGFGIKSNP